MKRAVMVVAVLLAGCQKSEKPAPPPPPPPTASLVTAMADFCKITTLPADKQREALKLWGWQTAGNKDVGPIWTAAVKKNASAIEMLRAAADAAVGPNNCPQLDILKAAP